MFLYVYVTYHDNVAIKSWLDSGCSRQPGCPWGHQIGDAHLIWCISDDSVMRYVMMEACDLRVSILCAGTSWLYVSHVVAWTSLLLRDPLGEFPISHCPCRSKARWMRTTGFQFSPLSSEPPQRPWRTIAVTPPLADEALICCNTPCYRNSN
jgi:hypothetical protein